METIIEKSFKMTLVMDEKEARALATLLLLIVFEKSGEAPEKVAKLRTFGQNLYSKIDRELKDAGFEYEFKTINLEPKTRSQ